MNFSRSGLLSRKRSHAPFCGGGGGVRGGAGRAGSITTCRGASAAIRSESGAGSEITMRGGGCADGGVSTFGLGATCAGPVSGAWKTRGPGSRIPAYHGSPVAVIGGMVGAGGACGGGCPADAVGVVRSVSALRSTATSFRSSSSCRTMLPVRDAVMIARINSAMGISATRTSAPSIGGVAPN